MMTTPLLSDRRTAKPTELPLSLVANGLHEVDRVYDEALAPFRKNFAPLVQHLKHYRGKRLRPALVLLAGHACGTVGRAHHVLGAVVEMIHTATLVHDDVLDEAEDRRHVRTVNAVWGAKTSLLLGDMLFSAAFRLCATVDARACAWIGDATNRVCAGELRQVSTAGRWDLPEADYFEIIAGKTGALTECCTRLGAQYAAAGDETVARLAHYGRDVGLAFQIADDVLDLTGDTSIVGKTLGTDIVQQKATLPLIRALAALEAEEHATLRRALQAGDAGRAMELVQTTGAVESASLEARRIAAGAKRCLADLPPTAYRTALEQIADWSVRRAR